MELIPITESGVFDAPVRRKPRLAGQVITATTKLYSSVGYKPPWICYFAVENGDCVGTCGFKSPPQENRVEIAYFTFPKYESQGVATRMASELIRAATAEDPGVLITAQTLPAVNASTSVLKKLGFQLVGTAEDEEVGLVWDWRLLDPPKQV